MQNLIRLTKNRGFFFRSQLHYTWLATAFFIRETKVENDYKGKDPQNARVERAK